MHRIRKMIAAAAASLLAAAPMHADEASATGIAEVAPFSALAPKAMTLGRLLANPLVPPLLLSTMQQGLVGRYGRVRSDKPLFWVLDSSDAMHGDVPVLPLVEGIAQFTLNNPGAMRSDDGVVRLPAGESRPAETVVAFDRTDGYAAFASSAAVARRALSATAAARKAAPAADVPVARIRIGKMAYSFLNMPTAGTNGVDVARKIAALDAALFIEDAGLRIEASFSPKQDASPADLCADLEKSIGASLDALGKNDGVRPVCRFTPGEKGVKASISLPAAEMAKAGKAFNSAVVQALAPSAGTRKPAPRK